MKAIHWITAAAALAFAGPVQAGISDPEVIIYRFPGVNNSGADGAGVATVFHCTNFSGDIENVRIVTRRFDTAIASNVVLSIPHLGTLAMSTHLVNSYGNTSMVTALVIEGTAAISATSINVICSAMVIDAASSRPDGVALRGIRFSPVPGSQE